MKKEMTFNEVLENLCETGERITISYKTLEMDKPEEYEGVFQKDPSTGNPYLLMESGPDSGRRLIPNRIWKSPKELLLSMKKTYSALGREER